MASRRIASVRRACYARLYYNLLYAEKICQRLPCLGRVFCRVSCNDSFKPPRRRPAASVRRVRWASAQRCGGRGDTREETISRQSKRSADSREGREGPRDVGLRSYCAIGRRSCTEIGRGILKFCCQCEENFRSVHTYMGPGGEGWGPAFPFGGTTRSPGQYGL